MWCKVGCEQPRRGFADSWQYGVWVCSQLRGGQLLCTPGRTVDVAAVSLCPWMKKDGSRVLNRCLWCKRWCMKTKTFTVPNVCSSPIRARLLFKTRGVLADLALWSRWDLFSVLVMRRLRSVKLSPSCCHSRGHGPRCFYEGALFLL